MDPNLLGQIILVSLQILKQVIEDQPKEYREKAWRDWFQFWENLGKLVR